MTSIYPLTFGQWPRCAVCFRARPSDWPTGKPFLAESIDPRTPARRPLINVCTDCYHALRGDGSVVLPAGDELAQAWTDLARDHTNGDIDDARVDDAITRLATHLTPEQGWSLFEELKGALLFQQGVEFGDITVNEVEPDLADPDVLADTAQDAVEEALNELCPPVKSKEAAA